MGDVLVLCYHAVSEHWDDPLSVTPARLSSQLRALVARGYRGITFTEAVDGSMDGRVFAVTFDDSYRSVHDLAFPIMSELGLVGTAFAVTKFVGSEQPMSWAGIQRWVGTPHEDELVAMSQAQLAQLIEAGWEIGSHTRSHPRLSTLDDRQLFDELDQSRLATEELSGRPCTSIAYPYGDFDERVVAATRAAGYRAAGTLSARFETGRPLEWPRVGVYFSDGDRRFRVKVSPLVRRIRSTAAWDVADAARWLLRGRRRQT
jgi:peptidoglycan/xylan/chitin deacetylase (PgdA/CDA1 family)